MTWKGPSVAESPTIATGLSLRHNAFNFLRLIGAFIVVGVHSPTLAGTGPEPRWGDMQFGLMIVCYFFMMSGFLITTSRFKLSGAHFTLRRIGRIVPALWLCFVVTALVISPLAAQKKGDWSWGEAWGYIGGHLLFFPGQDQLTSILEGNPNSFTWNGSAWTIPLELICYTFIGCGLAVPALRRHLRVLSSIGLVGILTFGTFVTFYNPEPGALFIVASFAVGVAFYAWQDVIRLNGRVALVAFVVSIACFHFPVTMFIGAIPFSYAVIWFAANAPDRIKKLGATNDISYGMYVYAWPLQQLLYNFGVADHGVFVFAVVAMVVTTVFGWASWLLVERRAADWSRARTRPRDPRSTVGSA